MVKKKGTTITCEWQGCGKEFVAGSNNCKHCPDCRPKARRAALTRWMERNPSPQTKRCATPGCGKEFAHGGTRRKYCDACNAPEVKKARLAEQNKRNRQALLRLERQLKARGCD